MKLKKSREGESVAVLAAYCGGGVFPTKDSHFVRVGLWFEPQGPETEAQKVLVLLKILVHLTSDHCQVFLSWPL